MLKKWASILKNINKEYKFNSYLIPFKSNSNRSYKYKT